MTRKEAKAATRAKLIEAAQRLFTHHGYEVVTIRQLAKDVGMSTGAVFSCFRDKADLFEVAMGEPPPDMGAYLASVTWAAQHTKPENASAALKALGDEAARLRRHLIGHHA